MSELEWNRKFAMEQAADDADLLAELIEIFKDSSRNDFAALKKGLEEDDLGQVSSAAHSIKGASASLGIEGINKVAKIIEEGARAGDSQLPKQHVGNLEKLLEKLQEI